jgi:transposase
MNSVRSQLAEFGVVAAQGQRGFAALMMTLAAGHRSLPPVLVSALQALVQQIDSLKVAIAALEEQIMAVARDHPVMRRLAGIPSVGGITAHAIVAAIGGGHQFGSARDFAAWAGLTLRQHCSAGKRCGRSWRPERERRPSSAAAPECRAARGWRDRCASGRCA